MRNVENQPLVISLDKGMDQSKGERSAEPGTLTLVKNGRNRSGRLQKRCGSSAIAGRSTTGSRHVADVGALFPRPTERPAFIGQAGDQKVAGTTAGDAFVYNSVSGFWNYYGSLSAAKPSRSRVGLLAGNPAETVGPYVPSCAATSAGYLCTAAGFDNELRVSVEGPDGTVIYYRTFDVGAAAIITRIAVVGSTFIVCYQGSASTTVSYIDLTVTSGDVSSNGGFPSLVTLANASSTWDVSAYDGTTWFLVYQSGATTVTLSERNSSATQTTSQTFASTDNLTYLSIWADPVTDRVWVGVVDDPTGTPSAQFRVYTDALALETGPTTLVSGGTYGTPLFGPKYTRTPIAGDAFYCFSSTSATGTIALMAGVVSVGTATTPIAGAWNLVPISKPDAQQRVWTMVHLVSDYTVTRICLLRMADADSMDATFAGPAGVVELASPEFEVPPSTEHPSAQPGRAFHAVAVTSEAAGGEAFFAFSRVLTSRTNASGVTESTVRVDVYEYTRYNQEPHCHSARAGAARVVANQPTNLWGASDVLTLTATGAAELGFVHGPSIFNVATAPDGAGLAAGTYVYQAIQHWFDDEGNRHLSPASDPVTVTLAVKSTVTLKITNCYAGQRLNNRFHAPPPTLLYRTQSGGTEPQLVPLTPTGTTAWQGWVSTIDTVADTIIDDNEFIYTGGGVLPNVLAPSCRYLAVSEERLWCGGLWDSNVIECSKVRVPGEPYNFTGDPSHQVVIPGEVSGLAYMDGQIGVFTEDAIYVVGGDGPNDQGAGGFPPPRALIRGVGCPRDLSASILETESGIIFRSKLAYYLIPRGWGSPVNIGEKVHDEDDLVLSAATTTTSEYRLARFLICAEGETKSDTVLTLDLTSMQWFRDTYNVDGASITGQGFSEIGEWPDGLALFSYGLDRADNAKVIWAESESLTGDAGAAGVGVATFISMYAQTAWQYAQTGPMGRLRVENVALLFEAAGACGLNISVEAGNDGSDVAYTQNATQWTIAASSDEQYRYLTVKFPECTAFRITLYDAATSGDSSGLRMIALGATVTPLNGMRPPLNATERQ